MTPDGPLTRVPLRLIVDVRPTRPGSVAVVLECGHIYLELPTKVPKKRTRCFRCADEARRSTA